MKALFFCTALILLVSVGAPSAAHHSGSMFDDRNPVTLEGTVRDFQWTNPHCYIQLAVTGPDGRDQEWSLEMGAPIYLYRLGWRPSTLKPGQKITARAFPLRSGKPGGLVQVVHDEAGQVLGRRP